MDSADRPYKWFRLINRGWWKGHYTTFKGKKPSTLEEGWDKTIEKWTIYRGGNNITLIFPYTSSCGLCDLFLRSGFFLKGCLGCPIKKHTGSSHCVNTPYEMYMNAKNKAEAIIASKKELNFLIAVKAGKSTKYMAKRGKNGF